jgi:Relaxase/Mobilisation nuclease domain
MIVGFSRHSKGRGAAPVNYLVAGTYNGTERNPPPKVVRGDPELVRRLIDSLEFKHRYTSGVLSFAPGEVITPEMEELIMDGFESAAFAGLDFDQSSILWVRHEHAGHHELHFLVPRVELATGKSMNIAPPGGESRALFDAFRSMINSEYGLADPDDPARAQSVSLPNHLARILANDKRQGKALQEDIREAITADVTQHILAGKIASRANVVRYLEGEGFTITREGTGYIGVLEPSGGTRIRLKGGIYSEDRFDAVRASMGQQGAIPDRPDPDRAAMHAETLRQLTEARARFNRQRYPLPAWETEYRAIEPREGEALDTFLDRALGDMAYAAPEDMAAAPSTQRRREMLGKVMSEPEAGPTGEIDLPRGYVGVV